MPSGEPGTTGREALLSARGGDAAAASALIAEHGPGMLKTAWRVLGRYGHRDAEDVVQEALISAWTTEALPDGDLGAWLRSIVARKALDLGRKRQRLAEDQLEPAADAATPARMEVAAEGSADLDAELSDVLTARRALAELSAVDRAILTLMDLEGFGTAEIATVLGLTRAAVKLRASRARKRMARWLQQVEGGS